MFQMRRVGRTRVETPTVKVRIQRNSRPSIRCASAEIPDRFRRVRVEFDGQAAYDALKATGCLPREPGRRVVDGLVVELGEDVRIW